MSTVNYQAVLNAYKVAEQLLVSATENHIAIEMHNFLATFPFFSEITWVQGMSGYSDGDSPYFRITDLTLSTTLGNEFEGGSIDKENTIEAMEQDLAFALEYVSSGSEDHQYTVYRKWYTTTRTDDIEDGYEYLADPEKIRLSIEAFKDMPEDVDKYVEELNNLVANIDEHILVKIYGSDIKVIYTKDGYTTKEYYSDY